MKKFFRKFAVLLLVFVLGVAGTAFLMNSQTAAVFNHICLQVKPDDIHIIPSQLP
jgi:hypothetical protein